MKILNYLFSGACISVGKSLKIRVFRASVFLFIEAPDHANGDKDPARAQAGSATARGGLARGDCYREEAGLAFRVGLEEPYRFAPDSGGGGRSGGGTLYPVAHRLRFFR
ncbi:hypothetical protein ACQKGL_13555 [Ensifer adhaerens]|uniref:hypothetical protein n=1 Tax=Ensifer adhaerens TaxID=106592 RepID=UPI003D0851C7